MNLKSKYCHENTCEPVVPKIRNRDTEPGTKTKSGTRNRMLKPGTKIRKSGTKFKLKIACYYLEPEPSFLKHGTGTVKNTEPEIF